jgi:hypothetical protein
MYPLFMASSPLAAATEQDSIERLRADFPEPVWIWALHFRISSHM